MVQSSSNSAFDLGNLQLNSLAVWAFVDDNPSFNFGAKAEKSAEEILNGLRETHELFDNIYNRLVDIDKKGLVHWNKTKPLFAEEWRKLRDRFRKIVEQVETHAAHSVALIDSMCATLLKIDYTNAMIGNQIARIEHFSQTLATAEQQANEEGDFASRISKSLLSLCDDVSKFEHTFTSTLDQLKDRNGSKKASDTCKRDIKNIKTKLIQEAFGNSNVNTTGPSKMSSPVLSLSSLMPAVLLCLIIAVRSGIDHAENRWEEYKETLAQIRQDNIDLLGRWTTQPNELDALAPSTQLTIMMMKTTCENLKAISGTMKEMRSQCNQIIMHLKLARASAGKSGQQAYDAVKAEIDLTIWCYELVRSYLATFAAGR